MHSASTQRLVLSSSPVQMPQPLLARAEAEEDIFSFLVPFRLFEAHLWLLWRRKLEDEPLTQGMSTRTS